MSFVYPGKQIERENSNKIVRERRRKEKARERGEKGRETTKGKGRQDPYTQN